jgi:hypothetical protein
VDPQFIDHGKSIDGFAIGGQMPSKFALGMHPAEDLTVSPPKSPKSNRRRVDDPDEAPYGAVGSTIKKAKTRIEGIYGIKKSIQEKNDRPVQSFILNSDMVGIRRGEQAILKEEQRFGRMDRAAVLAGGVEAMQAAMMEMELAKQIELEQENARKLKRLAHQQLQASQASAEGFSKPGSRASKNVEFADLNSNSMPIQPSSRMQSPHRLSPLTDANLAPIVGSIASINNAHTPTPSKAGRHSASGVGKALPKYHKKRSLGDRLAEIARLRSDLEAEKAALDNEQRSMYDQRWANKKTPSADGSRQGRKLISSGALVAGSDPMPAHFENVLAAIVSADNSGKKSSSPPRSPIADFNASSDAMPMSPSSAKYEGFQNTDAQFGDAMTNVAGASDGRQSGGHEESGALRSWEDIMHAEGLDHVHKHHHVHHVNEEVEEEESDDEDESEAHRLAKEKQDLREWRLQIVALGKRKGRIPPPELFDVLDYFATVVTRMVMGHAGRRWTKKHRVACLQSTILIQARIRGFLVRNRNWIKKRRHNAATDIQRCLRGYKSRVSAWSDLLVQLLVIILLIWCLGNNERNGFKQETK